MNRRTLLTRTLAFAAAPALLGRAGFAAEGAVQIRDLYERGGGLSAYAQDNADQRIAIKGFMAPPLKADSRFFVLTKLPMSVCPFCETEADWPSDILGVYGKRTLERHPFNKLIEVRGVLRLGAYREPDTGFLSMVRLDDATYG